MMEPLNFTHILTFNEFRNAVEPIISEQNNLVIFRLPWDETLADAVIACYSSFVEHIGGLLWKKDDEYFVVYEPYRKTINRYYANKFESSGKKNRMGCSEDWYDCFYAITQALDSTVIDKMSDETIEALIEVISAVQLALY